jgi:hypothetical protein
MSTTSTKYVIASLRAQLAAARVEIARLATPNTGAAKRCSWVDAWYLHTLPSAYGLPEESTLASYLIQVRYRQTGSALELECGDRRKRVPARTGDAYDIQSRLHLTRGDALRALGRVLESTEQSLYGEIGKVTDRLEVAQRLRREVAAALVPPGSNQPLPQEVSA